MTKVNILEVFNVQRFAISAEIATIKHMWSFLVLLYAAYPFGHIVVTIYLMLMFGSESQLEVHINVFIKLNKCELCKPFTIYVKGHWKCKMIADVM